MECTAQPNTESSSVAQMPPCNVPNGLANSGRVTTLNDTVPNSMSSSCIPSRRAMGGIPSPVPPMLRSSSSPDRFSISVVMATLPRRLIGPCRR
ncbi:Uncharacterised protein [Mycobacteroides abscessus subsp. abscessus]|nr:Uncharacterised protein [Mycobacteroides abscessus subsp. abscessus]